MTIDIYVKPGSDDRISYCFFFFFMTNVLLNINDTLSVIRLLLEIHR